MGCFSMPKGVPDKQYTPEFKKTVVQLYCNRRIRAKRKGLPSVIHRQQALSAA